MKNYLKQNYKLIIIKVCIVLGVVALDLTTKALMQNHFKSGEGDITIIKGVLSFSYCENDGVAWSMLAGKGKLIAIMSIVLVVAIIVFDYFNTNKNFFNVSGFALIVAGAIGNMVDRFACGYKVRDFVSFDFINFPVFNVADIAITFGCIFYIIYLLFYSKKYDKAVNDANKSA